MPDVLKPHSVRVPDHLAGDVGLILSVLGWDAVDPEPASWGGQRAAARDALVGLVEQLETCERDREALAAGIAAWLGSQGYNAAERAKLFSSFLDSNPARSHDA